MKKLLTKIEKLAEEVVIDELQMKVSGKTMKIIENDRGACVVEVNGETYRIDDIIELDEIDTYRIEIGGYTIDVKVEDPISQALTGGIESSGDIESPMSGQISNIHVQVGQEVKEGQLLLVISAMKMENKINSPVDGTITEIKTEIGESVQAGSLLILIDPLSE